MRIAIVSPLVIGASAGYRKYMRDCVPYLLDDPRVSAAEVYCSPATVEEHPIGDVPLTTWPADDRVRGFGWLKGRLAQQQPDVVFVPSANWLDCGLPVVSMVRNTEPLMAPFSGNSPVDCAKNLVRARLARQACVRSDRVIAVSHSVRDLICKRWRIPEARVGVVYHGVEHPDPHVGHSCPPGLDGVRQFLFTAGSIRPARGLEDAVAAMETLVKTRPGLMLVIAGKVDDGARSYRARLEKQARRAGVIGAIIWAGHLAQAEMSWCYRSCEFFIMTSRAEACPNTALEAMAHGCRIVSTTQPPMPEFFGEDVAYYSPRSGASLADAVSAGLDAPAPEVEARRAAVLRRAMGYDWRRTARATIDELERVTADRVGSGDARAEAAMGGGS